MTDATVAPVRFPWDFEEEEVGFGIEALMVLDMSVVRAATWVKEEDRRVWGDGVEAPPTRTDAVDGESDA